MEEKIRVLNITQVFQAAGIEAFIMNMYRNLDRDKVQFDFLVMRDEVEYYDDEIKALGGRKYTILVKCKNALIRTILESIKLYRFLKVCKYKIVHIHYTTPLKAFYLVAAKKAGVPVRIYHSHSAEVLGKSNMKIKIYDFCKKKITEWATDYFACSKAAAKWIFEKKLIEDGKVKVICNGIDVEKFRFNSNTRDVVRNELGIEKNYVIIHTGRFLEQKNHKFIINLFGELKRRCSCAKLLLVGTGDLVEETEQLVKENKLENDVIFLGVRSDVERLLCAADCYIMPSLYEGLPVAAVEAECSGLPCILSENITKEVRLTSDVEFLPLDESITTWCEKILYYKGHKRKECIDDIRANGYSIYDGAKKLQKFYINCIERNELME